MIIDTSFSYIFHKRVVHKLIKDLSSSDNPTVEFVDRSESSKGLLQVHASNIQLRRFGYCPEQYEKQINEEDRSLDKKQSRDRPSTEISSTFKNLLSLLAPSPSGRGLG
jgi:hypothetical protein